MTTKQIKKAIASRERKVSKYLARLAILQDHQTRLDEKVCDIKVELYTLRGFLSFDELREQVK